MGNFRPDAPKQTKPEYWPSASLLLVRFSELCSAFLGATSIAQACIHNHSFLEILPPSPFYPSLR